MLSEITLGNLVSQEISEFSAVSELVSFSYHHPHQFIYKYICFHSVCILKFAHCLSKAAPLSPVMSRALLYQSQHEPSLKHRAHPLLLALIVAAII